MKYRCKYSCTGRLISQRQIDFKLNEKKKLRFITPRMKK